MVLRERRTSRPASDARRGLRTVDQRTTGRSFASIALRPRLAISLLVGRSDTGAKISPFNGGPLGRVRDLPLQASVDHAFSRRAARSCARGAAQTGLARFRASEGSGSDGQRDGFEFSSLQVSLLADPAVGSAVKSCSGRDRSVLPRVAAGKRLDA